MEKPESPKKKKKAKIVKAFYSGQSRVDLFKKYRIKPANIYK